MNLIKNLFLVIVGFLAFTACQQDFPTADEHYLNYDIPQVEVNEDYQVGAKYYSFSWSQNITKIPATGQYNASEGDPVAYEQHVKWAKEGGINFFIFPLRSGAMDPSLYEADSSFIANLQSASNSKDLNYALEYQYAFQNGYGNELAEDNKIEDTRWVQDGLVADFKKMQPFFEDENYMETEDGKKIVLISSAQAMFAHDNAEVYQTLRNEMADIGIELYIIGEQYNWSPPLRFEFRFEGGVDAVSHNTYARIGRSFYDRKAMFHNFVDTALTYSRDVLAEKGLEYIPQISPSFNNHITNPSSSDYIIPKNREWFIDFCNVAKRASSPSRIIIVDSFNNWNFDTQLEPAQSYGKTYLEIVKNQFKK